MSIKQLRYWLNWLNHTLHTTNKWGCTTGVAILPTNNSVVVLPADPGRSRLSTGQRRDTLWMMRVSHASPRDSRGIYPWRLLMILAGYPLWSWLITWTMRWTRKWLTVIYIYIHSILYMSLFLDKWCKNNVVENHNFFGSDIADSCS